MNGKQSRRLRKIIREDMKDFPPIQYQETKVHNKNFFTGNTNLDGTPQFITMRLSTRELVACQRKAYQVAKSLHHMYRG